MAAADKTKVRFEPSGAAAVVDRDSTIAEALRQAGITMPLDCGGNGTCGRCVVTARGELSPPDRAEAKLVGQAGLDQGRRLACRTRLLGEATVWLPPTAELSQQGWPIEADAPDAPDLAQPVVRALACAPPEPTLEDHRADLRRVCEALPGEGDALDWRADHQVARQATLLARAQGWRMNAYARGRELVGLATQDQNPLGVAVDLGSTKVAVYLLDLGTGRLLGARGRLNPQVTYGADVITRLHKAMTSPKDAQRMARLAREAVAALIEALAEEAGADPGQICEVCLVGNTAMTHILLGLPVGQLSASPFVASVDSPMDIKARDLGLDIAPGAYVHIPPSFGGFVGADHTAMILGSDLDQGDGRRLGLDIGTNTEIVLSLPGQPHRLFVGSAPSGPTFEGAHLSSGMRAMAGAISKVSLKDGRIACEVIGGGPAAGICGSGIIDALAVLRRLGLLDERGRLDKEDPRLTGQGAGRRLVLASGEATGGGPEVAVTQSDISQVQLAKAAIMAGVQVLYDAAGFARADLDEVVLAGSFGSHFDAANARLIGLIPDAPGAVTAQVGNAAGRGARRMLLSLAQRRRACRAPGLAHYLELSDLAGFKAAFARNLSFPPLSADRG